jgi:hypothetical protein
VLPPISLAGSETIEISVISAAGRSALGTCTGTISFFGPDGTPIATPTNFSIDDKAVIHTVNFPYTDIGAKELVVPVSAEIALTASPITTPYHATTPPCIVNFSARIFDPVTGATHASIAGQSSQVESGINSTPGSAIPGFGRNRQPRR